MKKFIAIAAVAISLTACNGGNTECTNCATQDSTTVDTTTAPVDTVKVDSIALAPVDTAK